MRVGLLDGISNVMAAQRIALAEKPDNGDRAASILTARLGYHMAIAPEAGRGLSRRSLLRIADVAQQPNEDFTIASCQARIRERTTGRPIVGAETDDATHLHAPNG